MTQDEDNDEGESQSPRAIERRRRAEAGDHSARVARALMQLAEKDFLRLNLDEYLHDAAAHARAATAHGARRREERRLAGVLRVVGAEEAEKQLARVQIQAQPDVRLFHAAEAWREKLIVQGAPAAEAFHQKFRDLDRTLWTRLVDDAKAERERGKPRGAAKVLFREVIEVLRGHADEAAPSAEEGENSPP